MKRLRVHYYNLAKHDIETFEAEEALRDGWPWRHREGQYFEVLGRTADGRCLQLMYEERSDEIWVFHGREMKDPEKRRYHRRK